MTTDASTPALLPCPFCGGEARRVTLGPDDGAGNEGGDVIVCTGMCGASSHVEFGFKENLVDLWNTRVTPRSTPSPDADRVAEMEGVVSEAVQVLERLPYGDWPGAMYSGKVAAANRLIRRARAVLASPVQP